MEEDGVVPEVGEEEVIDGFSEAGLVVGVERLAIDVEGGLHVANVDPVIDERGAHGEVQEAGREGVKEGKSTAEDGLRTHPGTCAAKRS